MSLPSEFHNGRWVIPVESRNPCTGCILRHENCDEVPCTSLTRDDRREVIFISFSDTSEPS